MIKIEPIWAKPSDKWDKIVSVYNYERYKEKTGEKTGKKTDDECSSSTDSDDKNQQKYSLPQVLANRISIEMSQPCNTDARRIVHDFLQSHFEKDAEGNINIDQVRSYLLERDLKSIILSFWRCVSRVWICKLLQDSDVSDELKSCFAGLDMDNTNDPKVQEAINNAADRLSKWNGIRHLAVEERDSAKRFKIFRDAIGVNDLPFFVNITKKDLTASSDKHTVFSTIKGSKKIKLRYYSDVYKETNRTQDAETQQIGSKPKCAIEILSDIFKYKLLEGDPRHELLTIMYVPVCPYCNRQYITLYKEINIDGRKKPDSNCTKVSRTTADLDHFYVQSLYPYLALNVYNFVPSCQICNSRFKGDIDFYGAPHLYPYTQKANDQMTFRLTNALKLLDIQDWNDGTQWKNSLNDIRNDTVGNYPEVVTITGNSDEAKNSLRTYNLQEVYQSHADYVYELIWKIHAYDETRIHNLSKEYPSLFSSPDEVKALVFGQYLKEADLGKRPLAKLTCDILADCNMKKASEK